jgi:hypothetical protein
MGWDDEATDAGAAGDEIAAAWAAAAGDPAPGHPSSFEPPAVALEANPSPRALHDALLAFPDGEPLRLDASAVERLSAPAMQVLIAALVPSAAGDQRAAVLNPSFAFTLAFEAYGLGGDNEPFTVEFG